MFINKARIWVFVHEHIALILTAMLLFALWVIGQGGD